MPMTRRYSPEWAPDESATIGMDFSPIIPPGVGIVAGYLYIQTNNAGPLPAGTDFGTPDGPNGDFICSISGRTLYRALVGGVGGTDYQFTFTAQDTDGNQWPRTALLLCAPTS